MSRRQRIRSGHDKRTTAFELARIFGHGTPLPSTEDQSEEEGSEGDFIPEHDEVSRTSAALFIRCAIEAYVKKEQR